MHALYAVPPLCAARDILKTPANWLELGPKKEAKKEIYRLAGYRPPLIIHTNNGNKKAAARTPQSTDAQ